MESVYTVEVYSHQSFDTPRYHPQEGRGRHGDATIEDLVESDSY